MVIAVVHPGKYSVCVNQRSAWHRFFFQGVHMLLSFGSSANGSVAPWAPGEPRTNKLIFIGRHLEADELKADFQKCIVA